MEQRKHARKIGKISAEMGLSSQQMRERIREYIPHLYYKVCLSQFIEFADRCRREYRRRLFVYKNPFKEFL